MGVVVQLMCLVSNIVNARHLLYIASIQSFFLSIHPLDTIASSFNSDMNQSQTKANQYNHDVDDTNLKPGCSISTTEHDNEDTIVADAQVSCIPACVVWLVDVSVEEKEKTHSSKEK